MEKKIKYILFGLIAVLTITLFVAFLNYSAKEALRKEKERLTEENTLLMNKAGKLENTLRDNEGKITSLNSELERVSQGKNEIERKYDLAKKGQEELMERLKAQQGRAMARPQAETFLPPTADAYWAGILKAKTDLELQMGDIRSELKTAQINNEQLQREKGALELDINTLSRDNGDLKRQLEYNQKIMDSIAQELVREKNDKIQIQESFKVIKNENATLSRQLKSLNSRKVEFERKLQQIQEDKSALERRLNDMETMLTDKISKINELKEQLDAIRAGRPVEAKPEQENSVELPPIVVRPQEASGATEAAPAQSVLSGKVLALNRDNNFVIIDLGEDAGIKVGDIFNVYRGGESIGAIEAIQTRKGIAACDIKKETKPIAVGDTVR